MLKAQQKRSELSGKGLQHDAKYGGKLRRNSLENSDIVKLKGDEGAMINLGGSNNIIYRKRGNVVTVTMIIDVAMNIQGSPYYLANLPNGFQPLSNVHMLVFRGDGSLGDFQIDTSGNVITYVGLINQTAFGTVSYVVS